MISRSFGFLFRDGRAWAQAFAVTTAIGVFLGFLGPFGSFLNGSRSVVVGYWVCALWLGAVVFGLVVRLAMRAAPEGRAARIMVLAGASLVAAALLSVGCRLIARSLWPSEIDKVGLLAWFGETLVMTVPFAVGYAALDWRRRTPRLAVADAQPNAFAGRAPARFGRDVLALQMEDHYVRVHTAKGSTLVLISLSQAMAELHSVPGLRVHRSWWVAKAAVQGTVQDGRNLRLRLSNGLQAPVARSSVAAVRSAGYLKLNDNPTMLERDAGD